MWNRTKNFCASLDDAFYLALLQCNNTPHNTERERTKIHLRMYRVIDKAAISFEVVKA